MHLIGFIIRIYHNSQSSECQICQCQTKVAMSFLLFWDVTQHSLAVINVSGQRIGPIIKGILLKTGPIDCLKMSARNYQSMLCNIPEERISQLDFLF